MKPSEILLKMEQSLVISNVEESNSPYFHPESQETIDPLQEFDTEDAIAKPKFYRLNRVVFAEPLESALNEENSSKDSKDKGEIEIFDNLIVCKKSGKKYRKYHFNVEDYSTMRCPQLNCLRTYSTKNDLKTHIRRVHCADRQKYICEHCGRGFPELHMLRRHANVHSDKTVECPVCGVHLRLRTSLRTHLISHSNLRPHKCDVCQKTFTRASSKATHVKFVHRDGLLECNQCEKRFSSRKQWSLHMTSHRQKKPD